MRLEKRLLTTESVKIQKGGATKQTQINHMVLTATTTGTLTITDGTTSHVIDVQVGINEFCMPLIYKPDADVTLTAATATISIFAEYVYK